MATLKKVGLPPAVGGRTHHAHRVTAVRRAAELPTLPGRPIFACPSRTMARSRFPSPSGSLDPPSGDASGTFRCQTGTMIVTGGDGAVTLRSLGTGLPLGPANGR